MKTTVWDFFAPVYERSMHSQKGIYDYMYNRISQVVAEKEVLELATGPGMIAKHIAASAKNVIACVYGALDAIADSALAMEIGARGLRSVMERTMTDIMYRVPSDDEIEKVVITEDSVKQLSEPVVVRKKNKGRNVS